MKVFSQLMEEVSQRSNTYKFHPGCAAVKLTHLCFADDLLIFSMGCLQSIKSITKALQDFAALSVLTHNPFKSTFYCSGVSKGLKEQIKEWLQIREGGGSFCQISRGLPDI